ncbi:MAG: hypothetical protein GY795_03670 [Desulfobacterales bacterium]|nr:hypothetical protein [Desulfobacterales bacterium]
MSTVSYCDMLSELNKIVSRIEITTEITENLLKEGVDWNFFVKFADKWQTGFFCSVQPNRFRER